MVFFVLWVSSSGQRPYFLVFPNLDSFIVKKKKIRQDVNMKNQEILCSYIYEMGKVMMWNWDYGISSHSCSSVKVVEQMGAMPQEYVSTAVL